MLPIFELRGSIPLALGSFDMTWWQAYFISIIGNMIPVPLIILFLRHFIKYMRRIKVFDRFFNWLFERTRRKTGAKLEKYEEVALILFVAIPLPVTGAWTGAIAAWLFDMEFKKSLLYIFIGVLIAGVVVTLVWYGAKWILETSIWAFIGTVVLLLILFAAYKFMLKSNNQDSG